jgi:hypothetical protein
MYRHRYLCLTESKPKKKNCGLKKEAIDRFKSPHHHANKHFLIKKYTKHHITIANSNQRAIKR